MAGLAHEMLSEFLPSFLLEVIVKETTRKRPLESRLVMVVPLNGERMALDVMLN